MRRLGLACVLLLLACDPNASFASYCALSGECTCSGTNCCSVNVCGSDVGLDCCTGSVCIDGHCTADAAVLSLSTSTLDFGRFPTVETAIPIQTVTLTNTGVRPAINVAFTFQVSSGTASEFQVDFSGCPSELVPGASCQVFVGLTPQTLGQKQAMFTVTGNVPRQPTCTITGTFGRLVSMVIEPNVFGDLSVESSPPGLACSQGCLPGLYVGQPSAAAYFPSDTVVSLDIMGLPTGIAVAWAPPCQSETFTNCTLTVTTDTQLTGSVGPALTIDLKTNGLPVLVMGAGQSCEESGTACGFAVSGPVTLSLQNGNGGSAPVPFVIRGWGGACSGTGQTCMLDVTGPTSVSLLISNPNTTLLAGPVPLATLGPDGSSADSACNQAAAAMGDSEPYVAWVATSTRNPASLLSNLPGWSVGAPYDSILAARTLADITGPRLFTAYTAPGGLNQAVITGANPDGTSLGPTENCQDWTSASGTAPAGTSGGVGYAWSVDIGTPTIPCSGSAMLACFGKGVGNLVLPPITPPVAITFTSSLWIPAGGFSGADSHCQADAADAGLSGTFAAASLHAPGGTPAGTYVRADGVVSSDPQNVDARGQGMVPTSLSDTYVWVEAASSDCNGWMGGPSAVGRIVRYDHGSTDLVPPSASCSEAHRLRCVQVLP